MTMFFLLPDEEKEVTHREYSMRRWIVFIGLFLVTVIIAIFLVIPSYTSVVLDLREKESVLEDRQQVLDELVDPDSVERLEDLSVMLEAVGSVDRVLPSEFVSSVIEAAPDGVVITTMSYQREEGGDGEQVRFAISGSATNRQTLIEFSNNLTAYDHFTEARIPVEEFTRSTNIDFNFTAVGVPLGEQ